MFLLIRLFVIATLITSTEGGLNTVFPPYLESRGLTVGGIGFVISLFGATALAARLPTGALYTRERAKALLGVTLALMALGTAGFACAGGRLYVVALVLLHGLAFGAVTTVMLALVIDVKPDEYSHGVAMGWYTASISAGYAVGHTLGGVLADWLGYAPGLGIIGLFPLAAMLVSLSLPGSREMVASGAAPQAPPATGRGQQRRGLTPVVLFAALVAFYINFLDDAIGTFFPLFGLGIGLSLTSIGALRSAKSLTATAIRPISGFLFRFADFRLLTTLAILVWTIVVVMLPDMRLGWVFLLGFIGVGLSRGLIRVTSATMVAEAKANSRSGLGLAAGLYNAGLDVGAFAGPIAGGLLADAIGIPNMFRLLPLGLLSAYLLATLLVSRTEDRAGKADMS